MVNENIQDQTVDPAFLEYEEDTFDEQKPIKEEGVAQLDEATRKELDFWDETKTDVLGPTERVKVKTPKGQTITDQPLGKKVTRNKVVPFKLEDGTSVYKVVPHNLQVTEEMIEYWRKKELQPNWNENYDSMFPKSLQKYGGKVRGGIRNVMDYWENAGLFAYTKIPAEIYGSYKVGQWLDRRASKIIRSTSKALLGRKLDPFILKASRYLPKSKIGRAVRGSLLAGSAAVSNVAQEIAFQEAGFFKRSTDAVYINAFTPFMFRALGALVWRPTKNLIRKIPVWGDAFEAWKTNVALDWMNASSEKFRKAYRKEHDIYTKLGIQEGDFGLDVEDSMWSVLTKGMKDTYVPTNIFRTQKVVKKIGNETIEKEVPGVVDIIEETIDDLMETFYIKKGPTGALVYSIGGETPAFFAEQKKLVTNLFAIRSILEGPSVNLNLLRKQISTIGKEISALDFSMKNVQGRSPFGGETLRSLKNIYGSFMENIENFDFTADYSQLSFIKERMKKYGGIAKARQYMASEAGESWNKMKEIVEQLEESKPRLGKMLQKWSGLRSYYKNRKALETFWDMVGDSTYVEQGQGFMRGEPIGKAFKQVQQLAAEGANFDLTKFLNKMRPMLTSQDVASKNFRNGFGENNLRELVKFLDWANTAFGAKLKGPGSLAARENTSKFLKNMVAMFGAVSGMSMITDSGLAQAVAGIQGARGAENLKGLMNNRLGRKWLKALVGEQDYKKPKEEWGKFVPITIDSMKMWAARISAGQRFSQGGEDTGYRQFKEDVSVVIHLMGKLINAERKINYERAKSRGDLFSQRRVDVPFTKGRIRKQPKTLMDAVTALGH